MVGCLCVFVLCVVIAIALFCISLYVWLVRFVTFDLWLNVFGAGFFCSFLFRFVRFDLLFRG